MKKIQRDFLLILTCGLVLCGCSVNLNAKGSSTGQNTNSNYPNPPSTSTNQDDSNHTNPIKISVSLYKHYKDGFDIKAQLLHAQTAQGTWTFRRCGKEYAQKNKGISTIANDGYMECQIPAGHENDKSYQNIYVNFTGTVNGEKLSVDEIFVVNYDQLNKMPLEREDPSTNPTQSRSRHVNPDHKNYLEKSFQLAHQGKVIISSLAANKDSYESVQEKYGKPDSQQSSYPYLVYNSRHLAFGIGKGDVLDDVRSFDPKLHTITRSEVVHVLGIPTHINYLKGQSIYVYYLNGYNDQLKDPRDSGNGIEFKIIFLLTKKDPTIDHISVYSPVAAFNPMAN